MTPILDRVEHFDERSRNFAVNRLLSGTRPRHGRVWRARWAPLDQGSEGACFTKDVLIRMADGSQRPIDQVRLLDEVVTAEGNVGRVLQTMARPHSGPLVRIVAWGHSHLRCTPEHPILTRRGYVPAKELTGDDWIALPRFTPRSAPIALIPPELVDTRELRNKVGETFTFASRYGVVDNAVSALPAKVDLSPAFGRLIGLYAAEGSQTANKVLWSYGSHERDTLVSETVELIKQTLGADARVQVRPNNSTIVVLYGKHWRMLFATLVPGTARHGDKHLSRHVTNAPELFLEGILEGWYDGDGHVRRRNDHESRDGISVSHRLALDMHAIAVALGFRPAIVRSAPVMNAHAATRQMRWNVTFPILRDADAPEETRPGRCLCGCGEVVPQPLRHRVNRYLKDHATRPGIAGRWRAQQDDRHLWRKVREVVEEPFDGEYVFNLHVEGDESYVAEGIGVHNCVGFSWAGELAATPHRHRVDNQTARDLYGAAQAHDRAMGNHWPAGASVLAGAKAAVDTGKVASYRWAFGIDEVLDTLVQLGPVVLGIEWREGMYDTAADGLVDVSGPVVGGHAIVAHGYLPKHPRHGEVVVWTNSWGLGYGLRGRGYIRVADLDALLRARGEACIPTDTPV